MLHIFLPLIFQKVYESCLLILAVLPKCLKQNYFNTITSLTCITVLHFLLCSAKKNLYGERKHTHTHTHTHIYIYVYIYIIYI